jgi:peptidoglycan/LPS O-acetylase OafA/YrhL
VDPTWPKTRNEQQQKTKYCFCRSHDVYRTSDSPAAHGRQQPWMHMNLYGVIALPDRAERKFGPSRTPGMHPDEALRVPSSRHFGLDAVLAVAIAMVLVCHLHLEFDLVPGWLGVPFGIFGVELFFVLSGLLIGDILLRDLASGFNGMVLRRFWMRRWLRTLPAYATTIAILFLALGNGSWLYVVFAQNVSRQTLEFLPTSWSLCVEEWFYVLFPPVLLALSLRLSPRAAFLAGVLAFLVLPAALRFGLALSVTQPFNDFYYRLPPLRLDAPALGLLLAWLRRYAPAIWARMDGRLGMLALGLSIWVAALALFAADVTSRPAAAPEIAGLAMSTVYLPLISAGGAAIIIWLHGTPRWPAWPCLRLPVLWGSRLSYGVYLVHLPIFGCGRHASATIPGPAA